VAIEELGNEHSVSVLCETLHVSRSAYYAWRKDECGKRRSEDNHLKPMIRSIFWNHKRRYGARRIAIALAARGECCGRRRVRRLLDEMDLVAIQPRSFKPRTTDSRHTLGYSPNVLIGARPPDGPNQLWVGDITYVPVVGGEFVYLAMLMDRFSRRIIGWDLQESMEEILVLTALQAAIVSRRPKPGLVHHTDRGGQYAGVKYRNMLARARMVQSMSRAKDCYDNAFMESCFGTIKTELEMTEYKNYPEASRAIRSYLNYYNFERKHSSIGYQTPFQFEQLFSLN